MWFEALTVKNELLERADSVTTQKKAAEAALDIISR
jgi:hypothetical protein